MTDGEDILAFDRARVERLLCRLEDMVAGDIDAKLPLTPARDELDAVSHGVNALADELRFASKRATEAERRRTDEHLRAKKHAERASEAKSVFLRTASHEIRTPIAAILGIADVLAIGGGTDDDRENLVERLRANSRALLSLVGNVLDMSRIDADKLELAVEPVSVPELAREVVHSLEAEAKKKHISLRADCDDEPGAFVETVTLHCSEPGKGSTFRVTLAASSAPASVGASDATNSAEVNPVRGVLDGVRVLLTDDNPDLQVAIGRVLKMDGAVMSFASNGSEAVERVRTGSFDVVLMDLLMPETNGLDATRILRREGCRIPIIAISADASPETRAAAADAGCDGYLCKPFEPSDLTASIRFARRAAPELVADAEMK